MKYGLQSSKTNYNHWRRSDYERSHETFQFKEFRVDKIHMSWYVCYCWPASKLSFYTFMWKYAKRNTEHPSTKIYVCDSWNLKNLSSSIYSKLYSPTQLSHKLQWDARGGLNILQVKQYFNLILWPWIKTSFVRGGGRSADTSPQAVISGKIAWHSTISSVEIK